jgi:hypothetical protein
MLQECLQDKFLLKGDRVMRTLGHLALCFCVVCGFGLIGRSRKEKETVVE